MILLVNKMVIGKGITNLNNEQASLIKRCCDKQLNLISTGQYLDQAIKNLLDFIKNDQIPSIQAAAGMDEFDVPDTACIVEIDRINDQALLCGVFPDDLQRFRVGSFYLDGTAL